MTIVYCVDRLFYIFFVCFRITKGWLLPLYIPPCQNISLKVTRFLLNVNTFNADVCNLLVPVELPDAALDEVGEDLPPEVDVALRLAAEAAAEEDCQGARAG